MGNINRLISKYFELIYKTEKQQSEIRELVLKKYGSTKLFRDALEKAVINQPKDRNFLELYEFYATFFTLADETESFSGFEKALSLNNNYKLLGLFGKNEETWIYLRDPSTHEIIAGINFSTYTLPGSLHQYGYCATNQIIYIFVKPEYRNLGIGTYLLSLADDYSNNFTSKQGNILSFCEQNAPELMSASEYFADNINALIDQCERLMWWYQLGYKRLKSNYIQPALNLGMAPCRNLTLNAKVENHFSIPSLIVKAHLERFFSITVFKGRNPAKDEIYQKQINWLNQHPFVETDGSIKYYKEMQKMIYESPDSWTYIPQLYTSL